MLKKSNVLKLILVSRDAFSIQVDGTFLLKGTKLSVIVGVIKLTD